MQLAMNASHAPRRCGSVARCACSKRNSSISLGAAKAGVTLISAKKVIATSTHFGFNVLAPPLLSGKFAFDLHHTDVQRRTLIFWKPTLGA